MKSLSRTEWVLVDVLGFATRGEEFSHATGDSLDTCCSRTEARGGTHAGKVLGASRLEPPPPMTIGRAPKRVAPMEVYFPVRELWALLCRSMLLQVGCTVCVRRLRRCRQTDFQSTLAE